MVLLPLLAACALAGSPSPEALLLGFSETDALSTWLVGASGPARLGGALALPRANGWWIVDVSPLEERTERDEGVVRSVAERKAWAAPAGRFPPWWPAAPGAVSSARREPGQQEGDARTSPDAFPQGASGGDSVEDQAPRVCEERSEAQVTFAGPDHLALEHALSTDCGARAEYEVRVRVVSLREPIAGDGPWDAVGLAVGVGPQAEAAVAAAEAEKHDECLSPTEWGVDREPGRFIARLYRGEGGRAFAQCSARRRDEGAAGASPPRRLVPLLPAFLGPQGAVELTRLRMRYPTLKDAFASPSGRTVVVVRGVGRSEAGRIVATVVVDGKRVAEGDVPNADVVMAQWAVGERNVARWRTEAEAVLRPRHEDR